jgi:hypothetical protein
MTIEAGARRAHSASMPRSPVLIRTASSISVTKIFPSPIFPVLAFSRIASKIHGVFRASINLAVALLAAKAFYLAQSHSFDACGHQGFSHRLGFKWFNDGLDFLHRGKLNLSAFEMASTRD